MDEIRSEGARNAPIAVRDSARSALFSCDAMVASGSISHVITRAHSRVSVDASVTLSEEQALGG